ncbi:hypothetical protein Vretimale_11971, partial [Volvox reticuliferus]
LMGAGNTRPVGTITGAVAAGTWQHHQQQRGSVTEYISGGAASSPTGAIITGTTAAAGLGSSNLDQHLLGASNRCNSPSSLVLLAMEVAKRGCILALYLSFPTCMPLPLLASVRESCEQLLGTMLVGLVRHKLQTPDIAPDLETLRAGVPGLYVSTNTASRQGDDEMQVDEQQLQIFAPNSGDRPPPQSMLAAGSSLPGSGSIPSHWLSTGRSGPSPRAPVRAATDGSSRLFPVNKVSGGAAVAIADQNPCQQPPMLSSSFSHGDGSSMSPHDAGSFNRQVQCSSGIRPMTSTKGARGLTATDMWDNEQHVIGVSAPAVVTSGGRCGSMQKKVAAAGASSGGISTLAIPAASKVIQALRSSVGSNNSGNKQAAASRGVLLFGSHGGGRALPPSRELSTGQQTVAAAPSAAAGMAATVLTEKDNMADNASTNGAAGAPAAPGAAGFRLMINPDRSSGQVTAPIIRTHRNDTNGIGQTQPGIRRPQEQAGDFYDSVCGVEGELSLPSQQSRYTQQQRQQQQQLMTSMMSVEGVDEAWGMRGIMGTIVEVLMATLLRPSTQGPGIEPESGDDDLNCGRAAEGLEDLHLADVLGLGANGLVLRGMLGTVPVAVKLVEMMDADCATREKDANGERPEPQACIPAGGVHLNESSQIRARRIMLRNATELALTRVINHVCIVQSFAVYDNVVMEKAAHVAGGITLRRLDATNRDTGGSPICTAIVQELCDGGTLADVLEARTFPTTKRVPASSPPYSIMGLAAGAGDGCGGDDASATLAASLSGGARKAIDLKGVYLTLLEIALALRHLHSRRLVHRDLKPANILLKSNTSDPRGWSCKLADFGFALMLDQVDQRSMIQEDDEDLLATNFSVNGIPASSGTTMAAGGNSNRAWYAIQSHVGGTVTHMAPEAMVANACIDASVDIYSLGIIFWELVNGRGRRPYLHLDLDAIPTAVAAGTRPVFSSGVPEAYRKMAEACWAHEPHRRPHAADVVSFIKAQLYQRC